MPPVRYIDSWHLFADADGRYSAYLPDDDGIHLTPAGADRLARAILDVIRLDWEITEGGR